MAYRGRIENGDTVRITRFLNAPLVGIATSVSSGGIFIKIRQDTFYVKEEDIFDIEVIENLQSAKK